MADFQVPATELFEVQDADQFWTDAPSIFSKPGPLLAFMRSIMPIVMERLHDGPEIQHASGVSKFTKVTQSPRIVRLRNAAG